MMIYDDMIMTRLYTLCHFEATKQTVSTLDILTMDPCMVYSPTFG